MSINKARSRVANEVKKAKYAGAGASTASVQDARRVLAEEKIKEYIQRTVASAPDLTVEQRDRLAQLVRGKGNPA